VDSFTQLRFTCDVMTSLSCTGRPLAKKSGHPKTVHFSLRLFLARILAVRPMAWDCVTGLEEGPKSEKNDHPVVSRPGARHFSRHSSLFVHVQCRKLFLPMYKAACGLRTAEYTININAAKRRIFQHFSVICRNHTSSSSKQSCWPIANFKFTPRQPSYFKLTPDFSLMKTSDRRFEPHLTYTGRNSPTA